MKKNQQGFSLIELLIVVVIIGIIAAIAIPNIMAARRSANEASAVSLMRTFQSANATYQASVGSGKFAANLAALQIAGLIDGGIATATTSSTAKNGYFFVYDSSNVNVNPSNYSIIAKPSSTNPIIPSGTREFFVDNTGVIRFAPTGVSSSSPPFNN